MANLHNLQRILIILWTIFAFGETVSKYFGLPDSACLVGKLCIYKIPRDAFKGRIDRFEISDATDEGDIPSWLRWNKKERKIFGVPDINDVGPHVLAVKAIEALNATHLARDEDVFTIYVREEAAHSGRKIHTLEDKQNSRRGDIKCEEQEPIVSLAILIDVDMHLMPPEERKSLLESTSKRLGIPVDRLRLHSYNHAISLKPDLLMAGPGSPPDILVGGVPLQSSETGTYVSWRVGCGTTVNGLEGTIGELERDVNSGQLSAAVGYRILSWQVMSNRLGPRKRRKIDKAYATPTPVLTPKPMTFGPDIIRVKPVFTTIIHSTYPEVTSEPERTTPKPVRITETERKTTQRVVDEPPEVVNSLGRLECEVGVLCQHKVKKDTFRDREEGSAYQLKLSLGPIAGGNRECVLNKNKRHLVCFSLTPGTKGYSLIAKDKNDQMASDAFEVAMMKPDDEIEPSHTVDIRLWHEYDEFSTNVTEISHFVKRLTKFFKDETTEAVQILSMSWGSTIVKWTNRTMPRDVCWEDDLMKMKTVLEEQEFLDFMAPHFNVLDANLQITGVCKPPLEPETPPIVEPEIPAPEPSRPTDKSPVPVEEEAKDEDEGEDDEGREGAGAGKKMHSDDNFVISTVIPIVIIVVLLIVAIFIACILWKRNRKIKAEKKEAKNDFVSKGAPVIFPDEVDPLTEKEPTASTPMLIKEERPPLPLAPIAAEPPAYQNGRHSASRTPGDFPNNQSLEMKERGQQRSGVTEHENPLYKPPPPLELGNTKSPRPKHNLPHQREPPPYVPP